MGKITIILSSFSRSKIACLYFNIELFTVNGMYGHKFNSTNTAKMPEKNRKGKIILVNVMSRIGFSTSHLPILFYLS